MTKPLFLLVCLLQTNGHLIEQCGFRDEDTQHIEDSKFIAGANNNPESNPVGEWPWMASIGNFSVSKTWNHQCGATLITKHHFLTAAHCARDGFVIRIGDRKLNGSLAVQVEIINKYIHPKYDGTAAHFDIAVFETAEVEFARSIRPVCFPLQRSTSNDEYDDKTVQLIGWGSKTRAGANSNVLKRVELTVFPTSYCNLTHSKTSLSKEELVKKVLPRLFQNDLICAGSLLGSQGSCRGDSGGPIMAQNLFSKRWTQIGIVSGAIGECGDKDYPGIFIRLNHPEVLDFITSFVEPTIFTRSQPSPTKVFSKRLSKVMVATGFIRTGNVTDSVEIVDLLSTSTKCQHFASFPRSAYGANGELDGNDNPIVCGGSESKKCDTFLDGRWVSSQPLTEETSFSSMIKSPFLNDSISLFVTGSSYPTTSDSAEVLLNGKWKKWSINLPLKIGGHCMVMLNTTALILIGGKQGEVEHSSRTHILDIKNKKWIEGPKLKLGRRSHSCARIPANSQSSEHSVIVVGGHKGKGGLSSVEILDKGSTEWHQGPELPHPLYGSAIVDHPLGGVALLGGYSNTTADTIYHLPHAGDDAKWELMPQRLQFARYYNTAFLIPDKVADYCEK